MARPGQRPSSPREGKPRRAVPGPVRPDAFDMTAAALVMVFAMAIVVRPLPNLDLYYEDCVIGGAGAFVIPIKEREKFKEAIRTKLVLEIAGHEPPARIVPASAAAPRISCMIGERMWQYRWGGRDGN